MRTLVIFWIILAGLCCSGARAQTDNRNKKVLFVLDASGSMAEVWQKKPKIDAAREILHLMLDSIARENQVAGKARIQVALRVFGHQSPKSEQNCQDTRLEVPFAPFNMNAIKEALRTVGPKGYTPISYSLGLVPGDFGPGDPSVDQVVILITDGIESCQGDPCAISNQLQRNGIILRPYIIGLGLNTAQKELFSCIGQVFNVTTEKEAGQMGKIVITSVTHPTTMQVNLLDAYGNPTLTNVNMTFYEKQSGQILFNAYHTMDGNGRPDTFGIDALRKMDVQVHTLPDKFLRNAEANPGGHYIAALETPTGTIRVKMTGAPKTREVPVVWYPSGSRKILHHFGINQEESFLTGEYKALVLTRPFTYLRQIRLKQGENPALDVPAPGILSFSVSAPGYLTILLDQVGQAPQKVFESGPQVLRDQVYLQPGQYRVIYRAEKAVHNLASQSQSVEIRSNISSSLVFR